MKRRSFLVSLAAIPTVFAFPALGLGFKEGDRVTVSSWGEAWEYGVLKRYEPGTDIHGRNGHYVTVTYHEPQPRYYAGEFRGYATSIEFMDTFGNHKLRRI